MRIIAPPRATALSPTAARPVRPPRKPAGASNPKTKPTFGGPNTSSACAAGARATPATGAKSPRRAPLRLPLRYKILPALKLHPLAPVTTVPAGPPERQRPTESPRADALQDLASLQVPLLAGVVSLLLGDALQDRFAELTRQLVDRGKRVLAAER